MSTLPFIILIKPQLAENIGMTARAMMNCGLYDLRIVKPKENHLSEKAISSSSGAHQILENATIYNSTEEAIADLHLVFATTARSRNQTKPIYSAELAAIEISNNLKKDLKCGIMFGPERTGLENDDVSLCNAIINIPLNPQHCSLNLSQAVLLVGYEYHKQQIDSSDVQFVTNKSNIASKEMLSSFYSFLEKELENWSNFKIKEKRPRMLRNIRNIFSRNNLTEQEINTLYGIINHIKNSQPK